MSLHGCMCLEERPANLSRKARPGSAEMSGCYGDLSTNASTEKYRMVKERRGEGGVCVCGGCQSRNGWMMNIIEGVSGTKGRFRAQRGDNCSDGTSKYNNRKKICFVFEVERDSTTKSTNTVMGLPLS